MPELQKIKGTKDLYGEEIRKYRKLEELIRHICYLYQYNEIQTPEFEKTEVFKRENDSSDVVNKEMYTFLDNGNRSLTLRPEGTAGVMRSIVENKLYTNPDLPLKLYYLESFFRSEKPQKGRYRIFHQFGVEVVGVKSPVVDAETVAVGYTVLSTVGLKDIKVLINTLGDDASRDAYRTTLKEHFKDSVSELCPDCQRRYEQNPLRILDCKVDMNHPAIVSAPKLEDSLNEESKEYFELFQSCLTTLGIPYQIEDRLVRGLDYYTNTVFEIISTNEKIGSQATLCGGGRYDHLLEYFDGPELSGIGFGLGMERLMLACEDEGIEIDASNDVDVYVMCLDKNYLKDALALATICRSSGFTTEMDYQGRSMKAQFKSVDRKEAKVVAILGEDEAKNAQVSLKNIETQEQVTVSYYDMVAQLDHWFAEEHDHEHGHGCGCGQDHDGECNCEDGECDCGHHHH